MTATILLSDLQSRGFVLSSVEDGVLVKPSKHLTDEDRQAIRDHKAELLALLRSDPSDGEVCPICHGELKEEVGKQFRHLWCPTYGHFDSWRAPVGRKLSDTGAPIIRRRGRK